MTACGSCSSTGTSRSGWRRRSPRSGHRRRRRAHHGGRQRLDAGDAGRRRRRRRRRRGRRRRRQPRLRARRQRRASRRFLADPDDGEWVALAPHDALPAPDCLARIVAELDARPDAGLACADYGDGATPVVDPYFGGIPGAAHRRRGLGARRLPPRHAAASPAGPASRTSASSTSGTSPTARRPTSACGPAGAGWDVGLVRGAMVRNPELHGALPRGVVPAAAQHAAARAGDLAAATTPSSASSWPRCSSASGWCRRARPRPVLARRGQAAGDGRLRPGPLRPAAGRPPRPPVTAPAGRRVAGRLAFLDAVRGVAALAVAVGHGLEILSPGFSRWSADWFSPGRAGVCAFFLVSGYRHPASASSGAPEGAATIGPALPPLRHRPGRPPLPDVLGQPRRRARARSARLTMPADFEHPPCRARRWSTVTTAGARRRRRHALGSTTRSRSSWSVRQRAPGCSPRPLRPRPSGWRGRPRRAGGDRRRRRRCWLDRHTPFSTGFYLVTMLARHRRWPATPPASLAQSRGRRSSSPPHASSPWPANVGQLRARSTPVGDPDGARVASASGAAAAVAYVAVLGAYVRPEPLTWTSAGSPSAGPVDVASR